MFGKRILILVPHPDDEVVASCAAIGRAKSFGAEIFVLYLTHGCIGRSTMWPWERKSYEACVVRRRTEGEAAALVLGITPVGWKDRAARTLWRHLTEVYEEIKQSVEAFKIDQLWLPAYEGGHADHDALNAVGVLFKQYLSVLEFAEYNISDGHVHSQRFPHANATETTIYLTAYEAQKKRELLALYVSEKKNLGYVKVERECWRPLSDYNYNKPPHSGGLWYARFQWVPFRHPRVDFTKPKDVALAIQLFLMKHGA